MTHGEMSELYELYALGVLSEEEQMEIDSHLAQNCPDCQAGVKSALSLNALLAFLPEAVAPPRHLRSRVLASVGALHPVSRNWVGGLGFAAACLLIAVAVFVVQERRRSEELADARQELRSAQEQIRRSSADLAKVQAAMQFLNQPDTEQVVFGKGKPLPPRGRVFINPQQGVLLLASNLPPAPEGKLYQMWLIPTSGPPKPAGLFQAGPQNTALYILNGPVDRAHIKAVAVTLEPATGSAAPTSTPIIAAPLSG
ncbi:MAG: anti-sigma factor [Bryobacteraceae bacterium]